MPVSRRIVFRAKGPHKVRPCDSLQDVRIASHVIWIVDIDKTVLERWHVESDGSHGEQDREKSDNVAVSQKARAGRSMSLRARCTHRRREFHGRTGTVGSSRIESRMVRKLTSMASWAAALHSGRMAAIFFAPGMSLKRRQKSSWLSNGPAASRTAGYVTCVIMPLFHARTKNSVAVSTRKPRE